MSRPLRSDSGETLLDWAKAGLGIVLLPTFIASDAIRDGALELVRSALGRAGVTAEEIRIVPAGLEDTFLHLTRAADEEAA